MKRFVPLFLLLSCLPAFAGEPARASALAAPEPMHRIELRIGLADAMDLAARATGGQVLQARPATVNGQDGYRIKILHRSGEVRVVFVDGQTGSLR